MNIVSKTFSIAVIAVSMAACTTTHGNMGLTKTQRNTAIGATVGGVAGSLIGGNTGSTLGGAALGGVIGSQIK